VTVIDNGPGIPDVNLTLPAGYPTSKPLGTGLPGAKNLVDEFDLKTSAGKATIITVIT